MNKYPETIKANEKKIKKFKTMFPKTENLASKKILMALKNGHVNKKNELSIELGLVTEDQISQKRENNKQIERYNNSFWKKNIRLYGLFSVWSNYSLNKLLIMAENIGFPIEGELLELEEY